MDTIRVIRAGQVDDSTAQTENLHRFIAISPEKMKQDGPDKLYMGRAIAPPHTNSGKHHHGVAETGGYCLRGRTRIYFGEDYKEFVEAGPGDFMYVPPHVPHIEANEWDEEFEGILVRSPENIVVNLED